MDTFAGGAAVALMFTLLLTLTWTRDALDLWKTHRIPPPIVRLTKETISSIMAMSMSSLGGERGGAEGGK